MKRIDLTTMNNPRVCKRCFIEHFVVLALTFAFNTRYILKYLGLCEVLNPFIAIIYVRLVTKTVYNGLHMQLGVPIRELGSGACDTWHFHPIG